MQSVGQAWSLLPRDSIFPPIHLGRVGQESRARQKREAFTLAFVFSLATNQGVLKKQPSPGYPEPKGGLQTGYPTGLFVS